MRKKENRRAEEEKEEEEGQSGLERIRAGQSASERVRAGQSRSESVRARQGPSEPIRTVQSPSGSERARARNCIGNRCSKRRRHTMLGFGRSGAALEALKKAPRTSYDTAWESGGGAMQGGLGHATRVFEGI